MHKKIINAMFPKIDYLSVVFGMPYIMNDVEMNKYILEQKEYNSILPAMVDNNQSSYGDGDVQDELIKNFCALKMYPVPRQKNALRSKIIDVFPIKKLREVNYARSSIILHLPVNLFHHHDELIALAEEFCDIIFIVAHCGNFYCYNAKFSESLSNDIVKHKNIFFDTAMVANADVFCELISRVGIARLLYGSDAPFSYISGRHIMYDDKIMIESAVPFAWVKEDHYQRYQHLIDTFPFFHIETIISIRDALKSCLGSENRGKELVFYNNANRLFGGSKL